jgi:hypothetical protein
VSDIAPSVHIGPATPVAAPDAPDDEPVVEHHASPFDGLLAKLAKAREELTLDLEVPRWHDEFGFRVVVRYAPLTPGYVTGVAQKFAKATDAERMVLVHAQCLVHCCRGVYLVEDDGTKLAFNSDNPDGPWPRFDGESGADLARTIGANPEASLGGSAIDVVKRLYFTEGDLLLAANELAVWSGETNERTEQGFETP